MNHRDQLDSYQKIVSNALYLWPCTLGASATLLNVSENIVYRIDATDGARYILRLHRQNNNLCAIESELAWMQALHTDGVLQAPEIIRGVNELSVQFGQDLTGQSKHYLVMFEFIEGCEPDDTDDVLQQFSTLGEIAARTHNHSVQWTQPEGFDRGSWNIDTLLGSCPVWGRWQDAPHVDAAQRLILNQLSKTVEQRLSRLGQDKSIYGLIHADMRRANLLVHNGNTRLIDFDDCGFSWYMYDFATAVSFIEDHPRLPEFKSAWLNGYCKWRLPTSLEVAEIDTLIMLRRLALLAWMGGHQEVPIVQELQLSFAAVTCELSNAYLATHL